MARACRTGRGGEVKMKRLLATAIKDIGRSVNPDVPLSWCYESRAYHMRVNSIQFNSSN